MHIYQHPIMRAQKEKCCKEVSYLYLEMQMAKWNEYHDANIQAT